MVAFTAPKKRIAMRSTLIAVLALAVALVTLPRLTSEAADPVYTLVAANWDGGGGRTTGANGYSLESSIGQPDAGLLPANATGLNMGYTLEGGFQHMQLPLDTNCDDHVNAVDALFELRVLAGLVTVGPCSADANRDSVIDLRDARIVRARLVGLP